MKVLNWVPRSSIILGVPWWNICLSNVDGCWGQNWDDKFEMLVTDPILWKKHQNIDKSRQHNDSVAKIYHQWWFMIHEVVTNNCLRCWWPNSVINNIWRQTNSICPQHSILIIILSPMCITYVDFWTKSVFLPRISWSVIPLNCENNDRPQDKLISAFENQHHKI